MPLKILIQLTGDNTKNQGLEGSTEQHKKNGGSRGILGEPPFGDSKASARTWILAAIMMARNS